VRTRSRAELDRHLDVLDRHLARRAFLAGDYSVADTLSTPLLDLLDQLNVDLDAFPRVRSWRIACASARPTRTPGRAKTTTSSRPTSAA
jgi:GSH-dependent disulfide-bond oxidoreductase